MRIDDTGVAKTPSRTPKSTTPAKAEKPASKEPVAESPARADTAPTKSTALDVEPQSRESNPEASRPVTQRQSSTAADLTSGKTGKRLTFDELSANDEEAPLTTNIRHDVESGVSEQPDYEVADPLNEEQRADVKPQKPFKPGSPEPEIPDFDGDNPTSTKTSETGLTTETFERDGVAYTRETFEGKVTTSYEQDGVTYNVEKAKSGATTVELEQRDGDGGHTRTLEYGRKGKLQSDSSHSSEIGKDGAYQVRTETLNSDGTKEFTETVKRQDGGLSEFSKTIRPSGTRSEAYSYSNGDTKVARTTETAIDGSSKSTKELTYTSEQPLESFIDAPKQPSAGRVSTLPDFPEGERGDTTITESEIITTDPKGKDTLVYSEESFAQTSTDIDFEDQFSDKFEDDPSSGVTRTISRVKALDENGQLVESTGVSQELQLKAKRLSDEEAVSLTRTDSWGADGSSEHSLSSKGFQDSEGFEDGALDNQVPVKVGGEEVSINPTYDVSPSGSLALNYDDYSELYSGDFHADKRARDYLGLSDTAIRDGMVDYTKTISYNADGELTREARTYGTVDDSGDGKTVTMTLGEDGRSWTYSDVSNDGKDYQRQTVWEGSDLTVYEEKTTQGNGEFSELSETRRGDDLLNSSSASRREITPEYLGLALRAGRLTTDQAEAIRDGGEPYYLDQTETYAKRLEEDGKLVTTEVDGEQVPVQTGSSSTSYSYSAADGYEVSEYRQAQTDEAGKEHSSTLDIVTDPDGKVPVKGRVETIEPSPTGTGSDVVRSKVTIDNYGKVLVDGQPAGEFEGIGEGGVPLEDYLKDPSISAAHLLQGVYKTANGAAAVPGNVAKYLTNSEFTGAGTGYGKLARGVGVVGFAFGIEEALRGALTGDLKSSLTGIGFTAGGTNAVASALAGLPEGALSANASKLAATTGAKTVLGKTLGAVGGAVTFGFGLDSWINDSGSQKTAGAINTAAGAIALGSAFFGPPGWIIGGVVSGTLGLIALSIGNNDAEKEAHATAPLWFEE